MALHKFFATHWDGKSPLLLGYSGGPDSKALLYMLLDWGRAPLHLAHVDHGWREESAQEARLLQEEAKALKLPFHSVRLSMTLEGNLEERAREGRLHFFESLFKKVPFQALLLAHQRDDMAETVLKRLFEGAHLPFLGMKSVSQNGSLPIWRPLLGMKRKQILAYLEKRNLSFFSDPTNQDAKFMRARMRRTIFPYLNETFGKQITENLSLLSERSYELQAYLEKRLASHPITKGPEGVSFPLNPLERLEARYLLQKYARLPRALLESILDGKRCQFRNVRSDGSVVIILNNTNLE